LAKVALSKSQAPISKAPAAKVAMAKVALAKSQEPTAKAPAAKAEAFPAFLAAVKGRFAQGGQKDRYKQILTAVTQGVDVEIMEQLLGDHSDLFERYKAIMKQRKVAAAPGAATQPGKPPPKPLGGAKAVPKALKVPRTPAAEDEAEEKDEIQAPATSSPAAKKLPHSGQAVSAQTVLAPLLQCGGDAAAQLVRLVLSKRSARASLRLAMLRHVRSQATSEGSYREMFILRGLPGVGTSDYAMEQVRIQVGVSQEEELPARFTHICSAEDFSATFKVHDEEDYKFDLQGVELTHAQNEARVQLATELGIHPLFIDNPHIELWEMGVYVRLAQKAGYEVTIVEPKEICDDWDNSEALASRSAARQPSRAVAELQLKDLLSAFETSEGDTVEAILGAHRGTAGRKVAVPAADMEAYEILSDRTTQEGAGDSAKRPAPPGMESRKVAKVAAAKPPLVPAKRPSPAGASGQAHAKRPALSPPVANGGKPEARAAASLLSNLRKSTPAR